MHETAEAVSLTYADPNLPKAGSLDYTDVTLWLKRFRKKLGHPFRYFICGEYGETNTKRPHYHAILFGVHLPDREPWLRTPTGGLQSRAPILEATWDLGHILCDHEGATVDAIKYVAGYVTKKLRAGHLDDEYAARVVPSTGEIVREERTPPFQRMSLKPGIGHNWLSQYWRETYATDSIAIDGKSIRPPFAYDAWLATDHDGRCGNHCPDHMATWTETKNRRAKERDEKPPIDLNARQQKNRSIAANARHSPFEERPFHDPAPFCGI